MSEEHFNSISKKSLRVRANKIKDFRCKNLIAVLEYPTDIKNIGTVIRNVNALGVEKLYIIDPNKSLPDDWSLIRDRKTLVKTSVAAVKWTFVKRFNNSQDCLEHLQKYRFVSIGTSPHDLKKNTIFLQDGDYTQTRLAVWFGNESRGLSDTVIQHCDYCVTIPMFGIVESLNLGTSTGIVLYEITKQRREYKRANQRRPFKIVK